MQVNYFSKKVTRLRNAMPWQEGKNYHENHGNYQNPKKCAELFF